MFCTNCGNNIPDDSSFCPNCGTPVKMRPDTSGVQPNPNLQNTGTTFGAAQGQYNANQQPMGNTGTNGVSFGGSKGQYTASNGEPVLIQDPSLPEGIFRDSNGAFHWQYELNMITNPVILFLIIKLFFGVCFGVGLMMALMMIIVDGDFEDAMKTLLIVTFGIGGLMVVIGVIAYFIIVAIKGGKYTVVHTMDETSVQHLQTPAEKDQSKKMRTLLFVMGMLSDSPSAVGLSMGARDEMESEYKDVKKVIASRSQDLIKVNNVLQHNHIYAYPHQYEFVFNFIASHCPNAKIKR